MSGISLSSRLFATGLAILALAACSDRDAGDDANTGPGSGESLPAAAISTAPPVATPDPDHALTTTGLSRLRIGHPVPSQSDWGGHGDPAAQGCHIITSPDYPGVYAIVEKGQVRRISVEGDSDVTASGLGVGTTAQEVAAHFPAFRKSPPNYVTGGHYLTAPDASQTQAGLRFAVDSKGVVTAIHAGLDPQLRYSEGCD